MLGKFTVIMADPPWDIHMELPYGTMADEEMRRLPVCSIQEEGFFFLWVTGRLVIQNIFSWKNIFSVGAVPCCVVKYGMYEECTIAGRY